MNCDSCIACQYLGQKSFHQKNTQYHNYQSVEKYTLLSTSQSNQQDIRSAMTLMIPSDKKDIPSSEVQSIPGDQNDDYQQETEKKNIGKQRNKRPGRKGKTKKDLKNYYPHLKKIIQRRLNYKLKEKIIQSTMTIWIVKYGHILKETLIEMGNYNPIKAKKAPDREMDTKKRKWKQKSIEILQLYEAMVKHN